MASNILPGGCGKDIANEVLQQLNNYNLADEVKCVCTDTTNSNTGWKSGAVKYIEDGLGRELIYLACRHHELEIIPKHLFEDMVKNSTGPDLGKLCKRFEREWAAMDKEQFKPATKDPECRKMLTAGTINRISNFVRQTLQKPQIRGDYEYFLQLVLIFIREHPPGGVRFRPPIALTSARFMGRIIYCLSMYLFAMSGQFTIEKNLLKNIRDVCLFIVTTYVEPWFTATVAAVAPRTDLKLLQNIKTYKLFSPKVSKIAFDAFLNHLWCGICRPFVWRWLFLTKM
ncbi:hypothetical protein FOCC_FOCC000194 [Frankliniella occidentalis]|nr:hypothetical protein FOCC_FOCC000194 [Frankliniella occidentalis]